MSFISPVLSSVSYKVQNLFLTADVRNDLLKLEDVLNSPTDVCNVGLLLEAYKFFSDGMCLFKCEEQLLSCTWTVTRYIKGHAIFQFFVLPH